MTVVRADPALRRRLVVGGAVILASILAGLLGVDLWRQSLIDLGRESPAAAAAQAERGLRLATIGIGALALVGALRLYRLARRVREERRWPPAGMRVVRDTRVVAGDAARRLGLLGLVMAGVLVLLALTVPLLLRLALSPLVPA